MGHFVALNVYIIAALIYVLEKNIFTPFFLFNIWWGVSLIISQFGFFNIEIPSGETYFLFLLGIYFFNLPYFLFRSGKKTEKEKIEITNIKVLTKKNRTIIIIMQLIVFIILLIRFRNVIQYLNLGGQYSNIRWIYYYTNIIMRSNYGPLINNYLINPIIFLMTIIIPILFFKNENDKKILFLYFLNLILQSVVSGGRFNFFYLLLTVLLSIIIINKNVTLHFRQINRTLFGLIFLLMLLFMISSLRSDDIFNLSNFIQTIIVYFSGSFIYFEKMHPLILSDQTFLFGGAFFSGLLDFVILALNLMGGNLSQFSSHISKYNQNMVSIGPNIHFNAFTTMFYDFMYDFGYVGIFINSFLFGLITIFIYNYFKRNQNILSIGLLYLIIIAIFESTLRWIGVQPKFWITIILLFIIQRNSKNDNMLENKI